MVNDGRCWATSTISGFETTKATGLVPLNLVSVPCTEFANIRTIDIDEQNHGINI